MADKPKLKYKVVMGYKPGTTEMICRPKLTQKTTYGIDQVVEFAIKGGYVTGQFENMKGTLQGFIEAMKELGLSGYDVSLSGWLRIYGELTGSCDVNGTLTGENKIKCGITALKELKRDIDSFSFEQVDKPENIVKITGLASVGSSVLGQIIKEKGIVVTGKNLMYSVAEYGDSPAEVSWEGLETPIQIVPTENDYQHQSFAWPTALESVEDGTVLEFTFTLHGGIKGSREQVLKEYAIFKTA